MNSQRVLVTGGSGFLGAALLLYLRRVRPVWETHATYFSQSLEIPRSHSLDLRDGDSVRALIQDLRPALIFHTAAQMLGALELLRAINAGGTATLAGLAQQIGARLIHLSTDMIFDGRQGSYREEDMPHPLTPYGQSKFEAESAVMAGGVEAVIVRTSLIYGLSPIDPRTRAVLDGTMARLFIDERRCPIEVGNLCEALVEVAESSYLGILNVAGPQAVSRYEFGVKLTRALGGDESRLIAARSDESGLVRPKDCTLELTRARTLLKTRLLGVDEVLATHTVRTRAG